MAFVLDASVSLAWCFKDETTSYTEAVLDRLRDDEAVVPSIWPLEVVNVLLVSERRGRLTEAMAVHFLGVLESLPVSIEQADFGTVAGAVWALARTQNLSSYDAAYLELAMREGLSIATQDKRLIDAARRLGVPVLSGER
jgi:predicted nucleic acid-binding protein